MASKKIQLTAKKDQRGVPVAIAAASQPYVETEVVDGLIVPLGTIEKPGVFTPTDK